jgi:hypothetical protein
MHTNDLRYAEFDKHIFANVCDWQATWVLTPRTYQPPLTT